MAQVYQQFWVSRSGIRTTAIRSYIGEGLVALFNRVSDSGRSAAAPAATSTRCRTTSCSDIGVSRAEVETEYQKPFWRA